MSVEFVMSSYVMYKWRNFLSRLAKFVMKVKFDRQLARKFSEYLTPLSVYGTQIIQQFVDYRAQQILVQVKTVTWKA